MTALAHSGLSVAARSLRALLASQITLLPESNIKISPPHNPAELVADGQQHVNLFFYHVGYATDAVGFSDPATCPVTLHCLIVPFGADSDNTSAGENELRLAGEVMRVLHENPRIMLKDPETQNDMAWVQLLPAQLTMDEVNKIWSLQQNTPHRLSISCQLTVVPVQLQQAKTPETPVSSVEVYTYLDQERSVQVAEQTENDHLTLRRPAKSGDDHD